MRITSPILNALRKGIADAGNKAAFAALCGVHPSTIGQYMDGTYTTIRDPAWEKIEPRIYRYLTPAARHPGAVVTDAASPCTGKPPFLAELCAHWDEIPEGEQGYIEDAARRALKKCTPAADRRRAKAYGE